MHIGKYSGLEDFTQLRSIDGGSEWDDVKLIMLGERRSAAPPIFLERRALKRS